ncbi:hypothetical protein [Rhodanobacter sp. PCA2]|uniref:hypothetical protein n=1 Tax=Rhodanobacter sp. PCA2 TaxID=2006117 RepID=UPI0015E7A23F|nr:hypothetical protein [Rhodanobacter sp. PCA2]
MGKSGEAGANLEKKVGVIHEAAGPTFDGHTEREARWLSLLLRAASRRQANRQTIRRPAGFPSCFASRKHTQAYRKIMLNVRYARVMFQRRRKDVHDEITLAADVSLAVL